jgi:carbon starvation protein
MAVLIPAILLWVTVTVALIWYEIVIIPVFFSDMSKVAAVITGGVVGAINLFMLILNFVMIYGFYKNFTDKKAAA